MFKLIAVLFVIANGVPADKPAGVLTYNKTTFPTEEMCKSFVETDDGKAALQEVNTVVESKGGALVVRFACVKSDDKAQDNSV